MPDLHDFGNSFGNVILQASFDDRLKSDEGEATATGDLCTLTPDSGKDLYITAAQVVFYSENFNDGAGNKVELQIDTTVKETAAFTYTGGTNGGNSSMVYNYKNMFQKISNGETVSLDVTVLDADIAVEGFIQAIEVPSGENPLEYRGD